MSGAAGKNLSTGGSGTTVLCGANTYSGAADVTAGTLRVTNATGLGNTTGATTIESGATLELNGNISVAENLTIAGGTLAGVSTPTLSGTVALTGATNTVTVANGADTLTLRDRKSARLDNSLEKTG